MAESDTYKRIDMKYTGLRDSKRKGKQGILLNKSENKSLTFASLIAQFSVNIAFAPLTRIKVMQQATKETFIGRTKTISFTESVGRDLIRNCKKSELWWFV